MMKIVISGLGVMGASMARALKQRLSNLTIIGYDLPEIMDMAMQKNIIDRKITAWPDECADADIIVLATPLHIIKKQLDQLADVVSPETVVTDMGSTKSELEKFVRKLNFNGIYIGGHPMTGTEKTGLTASNPLLYENAVYVLTGITSLETPVLKQKLLPVLEALKARVLIIDSETHDQIMAAISHVPQLLAIALVNLVGRKNEQGSPYFELAAGGFRDLTRIASSSINIWQDIVNSNQSNIKSVLDELIALIRSEKDQLGSLYEAFNSANMYRHEIPNVNKGFLSPLTEVFVYVNDELGVVSKISNALYEKNIDIRDIELLKIREKEGGVFRLSFSTFREAKDAVRIMKSINYDAYIRES
ncbi:MAG: prephenate dehydrogenase/arogenate dehydrogenase family protein [Calditrichaceae bacterium]